MFNIDFDEITEYSPRMTDLLYHGAPATDEDIADYLPRDFVIKAVRVG